MKTIITILAVTVGVATWTSPVIAGDHIHAADVTSGRVHALQAGDDITGHATMIRSDRGGGHTSVTVHVRGLDPDTSYPTHVHNRPCAANPPGGSHYQRVVGGPVDGVNEIWPTVRTNAAGVGLGQATHGARARDDALSIVVHNPANPSIRLACVDLT